MTIEDQIKDEKLQYDINREAAKISALSSGKLDKYEHLTGEEILSSNQQQIIQQAKFNYSPLGKTNINMLYNARNEAIKFIEDYGPTILEAKKLAREQEGTGLKILTPNQMLKILPIALAQVKAGNNSESLLNEIRQIVYSLIRY